MVSQILKEQSAYSASFRALQESSGADSPSWVERLRETAFASFEKLGFPTVDGEEWKYTNVAPIAKAKFEAAFESREEMTTLDAARLQSFTYQEASSSQLVFVNGFYRPELSSIKSLPGEVVAIDIADALQEEKYSGVVREQLARSADFNENAFTALNTAFIASGAFILIPKGVQLDAPVHLLFLSDGRLRPTVSFPRVLIVAESGSAATVIESYAGISEDVYFTNAVVEINLMDGARLTHNKVQRESAAAFHVATTQVSLARNSSFDTTTITLGAELSRHNINVTLDEEGAECWVDGLYLVGTGQHADTHSLIDHRQPHCTSHQLYKGILDGKSRAVFNGKVFVRPNAQQTDAKQTNRNLLLSNEARVDTKPQLEIFADDVKCAHGATVGQLEEEELFYLASRGLDADLARNLLTYGFAEEVIAKIKVESIKTQLDEAVLNRLHSNLEAQSL
ncbi:MAG: Fe-S cluster assembly protein SufD [Acidobacteriota bacterium]|jgi:Fe-S cluster assembly protein SufD|nr:Fe-S cluster assembly protein SufD [Acidobacteriota bacterium]